MLPLPLPSSPPLILTPLSGLYTDPPSLTPQPLASLLEDNFCLWTQASEECALASEAHMFTVELP